MIAKDSNRKSIATVLVLLATMSVVVAFQWTEQDKTGTRNRQSRAPEKALAQSHQSGIPGDPVAGISAEEFELFRLGLDDFLELEDAAEGLGPVFNGLSCAQCHAIPAVGGSGLVLETRAGILHQDGSFEELPGGSNFQMFAIPTHSLQPAVPKVANSVAHRKSLPLFGGGLVEAIPDATLIAMEDPEDLDGDGISGRAARVLDKASGRIGVGRFGWKAQQVSLLVFGAEAYRDEMGITSDLFPTEACPYGVDCEYLEFIDPVADPEDEPEANTGLRGIDNFENFMRFLGPPGRGEITDAARAGEAVFRSLGCQSCHVERLESGPSSSPALSQKTFYPYGDFLLHDVATGDGIGQADALPNEIRTMPLWGLRFRGPFLHNGSVSTVDQAIRAHGAEAEAARVRYEALSEQDLELLLAFLDSL